MAAGVLLFTAITLAITNRGSQAFSEAHRAIIHTLSLTHVVLAAVALPLGLTLFALLLRPMTRSAATRADIEERAAFARRVQTAYLFRAATFEGVALFGLVISFLAGGARFFSLYPVYWLNLATPVLFVLYMVATFPNRARLESLYRTYGFGAEA